MPEEFADARIEELSYLAEVARMASKDEEGLQDGARRQMIASLIDQGFLNDILQNWGDRREMASMLDFDFKETRFEHEVRVRRVQSLAQLLSGQYVRLTISHKGRVRLSELKQELQKDRIRDSFGIAWDGRHLQTDFKIAALQSDKKLLSMAFLDLNGLKQMNDEVGHAAGDEAIRGLLESAIDLFQSDGGVYRVGGDEVVVLMSGRTREEAEALLESLCRAVQTVKVGDSPLRVSVSIGLAQTNDPKIEFQAVKKIADSAMYSAKELGKQANPRQSTLCFADEPPRLYKP